jgi:hypothetical protein
MSEDFKPATRRAILIGAATLAGLPLLAAAGSAEAAGGTLPKANAHYVEKPNGAKQCSKCTYFLAGAGPKGAGTKGAGLCKVVAGPILPTGYCLLFAPKAA